ncbi:hypothetical protein AAMO2058_000166600 [Amorphochlora amoebiformis]
MAGRSTYGRDSFELFRVCFSVLIIIISVFFATVHTVDLVRRWNKIQKVRSAGLKVSITVCNLISVFLFVPFAIVNTLISVDDNIQICRGIHLTAIAAYITVNFSIYRVLLHRSQAYDVMAEYAKFYSFVWWSVHILSPLLIIITPINAGIGEYEIKTKDINGGSRMCVVTKFTLLPFIGYGWMAGLLVALIDFLISLGCLVLLILPIFQANFNFSSDTGVLRNVVCSSIAIFSTFGFLVATSVIESKEGFWTVGFLLDIGVCDLLINLIAVNLCWPVRFYLKYIMYALGKKDSLNRNSDMSKMKHKNAVVGSKMTSSRRPNVTFTSGLRDNTSLRHYRVSSTIRIPECKRASPSKTSTPRSQYKVSRSKTFTVNVNVSAGNSIISNSRPNSSRNMFSISPVCAARRDKRTHSASISATFQSRSRKTSKLTMSNLDENTLSSIDSPARSVGNA